PVEVKLANRIGHELWISSLRVTLGIDPAHAAAGCSAGRDFLVSQLPASMFPIRLPARSISSPGWPAHLRWPTASSWTLASLGIPALPSVTMVDLAQIDQDGCKGATLQLGFSATSRLMPPQVAVRTPCSAPRSPP